MVMGLLAHSIVRLRHKPFRSAFGNFSDMADQADDVR
jgi:hypothetical protein